MSGGIWKAIDRAEELGCDAVQIFTQSPRMWRPTAHTEEALARFRERRTETGIGAVVSAEGKVMDAAPRLRVIGRHGAGVDNIDVVAAAARKIFLVDRPGSVQTTVALGNIAIDRRSPDYLPMTVMNHVIGGGAAGRLFLNLREEKGYTYGVYSNFTALRYPGPWQAGGNMRTEVTAAALVEFFNEIRRIRDEKVPTAELAAGKRAIAARFALSLEQPAAILGLAIARKQYDLTADYWDNYPAKIMAVSADEVQRVARKYLSPDVMQLVAVGDAGKLKGVLAQYGAVEVYDEAGRPVRTGTQPN